MPQGVGVQVPPRAPSFYQGLRLSAKKWGRGQLLMFWLTALGDDAQAVVVEVSEAVGAALDEFHLSVEALGDAIVAGEAPHGDQGLSPAV